MPNRCFARDAHLRLRPGCLSLPGPAEPAPVRRSEQGHKIEAGWPDGGESASAYFDADSASGGDYDCPPEGHVANPCKITPLEAESLIFFHSRAPAGPAYNSQMPIVCCQATTDRKSTR